MSVPGESASAVPQPQPRLRVFVNRFIFRAMLFASGSVAIALYQVNRALAWRFAKLQARNLVRLCGVEVRVRGLENLATGPYVFTPNHQSHFDIAALLGFLPGSNRFAADVEDLGVLLQRDLSHWLQPAAAKTSNTPSPARLAG